MHFELFLLLFTQTHDLIHKWIYRDYDIPRRVSLTYLGRTEGSGVHIYRLQHRRRTGLSRCFRPIRP